uniref:Uncharacterized protein n=1 Tax=Aquila chrysaetos chrysaetos TaxID=223781 RepID=A0A663DR26_AQUCH
TEKDLEITKPAVQSRALAPTRISPNDVPHQQEECVPGRGAEIGAIDDSYHDVCVSIEEFDEFFQAPEAALQAAQEELGKLIICSWRNILQCDPDDLDDGEDQRAKGKRAGVRDIPERTAEGGEEGEGGHVVGFLEGPVVRREGPCQRHLAQCDHEVGEPEEHEDIEELKDDEILVVRRLAPVECERGTGGGQDRLVGGGEETAEQRLRRDTLLQTPNPNPNSVLLSPASCNCFSMPGLF